MGAPTTAERGPLERWPHPACLADEDLLKACSFGRGRSSGPGGQHRNKVETEVTLTHLASNIAGKAGERRSQGENKRVALWRLRLNLAVGVRSPAPRGEIGSALWRSRTRGGRIFCNPEHHDFPAMLAEALDVIADGGWDPKHAALRLGVTPTQLIRFVKDHPPAFEQWNGRRREAGAAPLK